MKYNLNKFTGITLGYKYHGISIQDNYIYLTVLVQKQITTSSVEVFYDVDGGVIGLRPSDSGEYLVKGRTIPITLDSIMPRGRYNYLETTDDGLLIFERS